MRTLVLLPLIVALAACYGNASERPKRVRKAPAAPSLVSTVTLPGDDGRVHVVAVPGQYEVSRCLVHVGPTGSTIACLPQSDAVPAEYGR